MNKESEMILKDIKATAKTSLFGKGEPFNVEKWSKYATALYKEKMKDPTDI